MSSYFSKGAILGASLLLSSALGADPSYADPVNSDEFITEVQGTGDVTLFLPGLTSSPRHFRDSLATPIEGQAHWITLAGFAGVPAAPLTEDYVEDSAAALVEYILANDLEDVQLVGHSLGGVLSLIIASRIPDRIDGVMIVDSVPFLPALFQPGITEETAASQAGFMRQQMAQLPQDQFLNMMRAGLPRQATSEASQALVFEDIETSDQGTIAVAMSNLMATDYSSILPEIAVPVTVLVPHNEFIGQSEDAWKARYEMLYEGLPDARFVIVRDSRHFIQLDQPDVFENTLKAFLEAHNG